LAAGDLINVTFDSKKEEIAIKVTKAKEKAETTKK